MTSAVVIPTKNRGPLLIRAIESALAQTLPVDEIIVIDDGSTDDTRAIVSDIGKADSRVRLIHLERSGGAAAARNIGVADTTADWICFLDSDDSWDPQKHAAQTKALAAAPNAVASFTGLRYAFIDHSIDAPAPQDVTSLALRGNNVVGSTSSAMVRKSTFDAVGGFDPALPSCQDWDLWMKLRQQGDFAMVTEPLVSFTQDSGGRISRNKDAVFAGHKIVFARALEGLTDPGEKAWVQSRQQYRIAQINFEDMANPKDAAKAALQSMAFKPTIRAARLFLRAAKRTLVGAPKGGGSPA